MKRLKIKIKMPAIKLHIAAVFICGVMAQPYIKGYFNDTITSIAMATQTSLTQAYDTKGMARIADAQSYIDMPVKAVK